MKSRRRRRRKVCPVSTISLWIRPKKIGEGGRGRRKSNPGTCSLSRFASRNERRGLCENHRVEPKMKWIALFSCMTLNGVWPLHTFRDIANHALNMGEWFCHSLSFHFLATSLAASSVRTFSGSLSEKAEMTSERDKNGKGKREMHIFIALQNVIFLGGWSIISLHSRFFRSF